MRRMHLFEFEDQPWFPKVIRNGMTNYLRFVADRFNFYQSVVPVLSKGLAASGGNTVIDLASGGGGGWSKLAKQLSSEAPGLRVILTDRYPNQEALAAFTATNPTVFSYEPNPVDARNVPAKLLGLRTQFLSLHHFKPSDAKQILENAIRAGQPIAIFEAQKRDIVHLIKFSLSPIAVLLMTPLIRPMSWSQIFFTYVLPVIPLCTMWDGIVSVLRTYSLDELNAMVQSIDGSDAFEWELGEANPKNFTILYMLGHRK